MRKAAITAFIALTMTATAQAHFSHPHGKNATRELQARQLEMRIDHARDVLTFFSNRPGLAKTQAGRAAAWQHKRLLNRSLRRFEVVTRPLLEGERPWHATLDNPVNVNLYRLAVCETGGINEGVPLWTHSNSDYVGALGFAWSTWSQYRHWVTPLPPANAALATPAQQLAVGRALVRRFGDYSSWPSCHRRLGLP